MIKTDIFVTGTDTNVGKTVVPAILAHHLKMDYWKVIQSGAINEMDSDFIKNFNINCHDEIYKLNAPLSPHIASKMENIKINFNRIIRPNTNNNLIIEGSGGILVPINSNKYIIDIVKKLNIPIIIVARTTLGTINHTLLTIEAIKNRKLNLLGIILNGESNIENEKSIKKYGNIEIFGNVNYTDNINKQWIGSRKHKDICDKIYDRLNKI